MIIRSSFHYSKQQVLFSKPSSMIISNAWACYWTTEIWWTILIRQSHKKCNASYLEVNALKWESCHKFLLFTGQSETDKYFSINRRNAHYLYYELIWEYLISHLLCRIIISFDYDTITRLSVKLKLRIRYISC